MLALVLVLVLVLAEEVRHVVVDPRERCFDTATSTCLARGQTEALMSSTLGLEVLLHHAVALL